MKPQAPPPLLTQPATALQRPLKKGLKSLPKSVKDLLKSAALGLLSSAVILLVSTQSWAQALPQLQLPKRDFAFGSHFFLAQMATTPIAREIGLMHRKTMPENEGMFFVFDRTGVQCFWMKNTLIPLSAAFITDDGRVVNIEDMQALSTTSHCSHEPVRFVLEMNQGWFKKRGLGAGSVIRDLIKAPPPPKAQQTPQ